MEKAVFTNSVKNKLRTMYLDKAKFLGIILLTMKRSFVEALRPSLDQRRYKNTVFVFDLFCQNR